MSVEIDTDLVEASLRAESLKGRKSGTVRVIFTAPYAVYVHEDLQMPHAVGQAKFLEAAAKEVAPQMREAITQALRNKKSLSSGLLKAGQILLRRSQELVPVDTGFLRDSGKVEATVS